MSAYDENYDAAPLKMRVEPRLSLRWTPGRYDVHHAEAGAFRLSINPMGRAMDEWECRVDALLMTTHRGTRASAQNHLETLVRDRFVTALTAFEEQEKKP